MSPWIMFLKGRIQSRNKSFRIHNTLQYIGENIDLVRNHSDWGL